MLILLLMNKNIYLFLLLSVFALLFLSCDKEGKIEENLQGSWDVINVIDVNDPVKYIWSFDDFQLIVLKKHVDSLSWDTASVGNYTLEAPNLKRDLITFSGFTGVAINGEYKILTHNEEMLIIIREESGLWKYVEMTSH